MTNKIPIEVAYGTATEQKIIPLTVDETTTAEQAVRLSNIQEFFPEIDLDHLTLGIFGKKCKNDASLFADDRVEIYRPLIADPKEVRKQRAAAGKKMKKGESK